MEINIGSSVHYLDYRKNYMFSHTATTLKKKTEISSASKTLRKDPETQKFLNPTPNLKGRL